MQITFFSVCMTVLWSSVLIVLFWLLRKRDVLLNIYSVSGILLFYVFCVVRMLVPIELPWTREVSGGRLYNGAYGILRSEIIEGIPFSFMNLLLLIWVAGTVLILTRFLVSYFGIIKTLKRYPVLKEERVSRIMAELSKGKKVKPKVIRTSAVRVPCCIGVFQKVIILPDKTYSGEKLYYILLHEYSHLENNDSLLKILVSILCAVYWWNPIILLLRNDLCQILEIRCDGKISGKVETSARGDYLRVLLEEFKNVDDTEGKGFHQVVIPLFEDHSIKILERFQLVANGRNRSVHSGQIAAFFLSAALLLFSYSFIVQTRYEVPTGEVEDNLGARKIDTEESYIKQKADGVYWLHTPYEEIEVSKEVADTMVAEGFIRRME